MTDAYGIPLIINDNLRVCQACGAAGVHVGQEDMPVTEIRQILGPDKIVGVTAKTVEQAKKALAQGRIISAAAPCLVLQQSPRQNR